MTDKIHTETNVKVCVRSRDLLPREVAAGSSACVSVNVTEKEISVGSNRTWKFDEVFDGNATQETVYNTLVKELVHGCFRGLNATVLACMLSLRWSIS